MWKYLGDIVYRVCKHLLSLLHEFTDNKQPENQLCLEPMHLSVAKVLVTF